MSGHPRRVLGSPAVAIATMMGAGFFPVAPGTVGSAIGAGLGLVLRLADPLAVGIVFVVLAVVFTWAADRAGPVLGEADHRAIVCDEVWAMAVVAMFEPTGFGWVVAGFLAFRLFDTLKPAGISMVDRKMKNGLGVMLDDGLAAVGAICDDRGRACLGQLAGTLIVGNHHRQDRPPV